MSETEQSRVGVDPMEVIAQLKVQIGNQAQEIAVRDALLQRQEAELAQLRGLAQRVEALENDG